MGILEHRMNSIAPEFERFTRGPVTAARTAATAGDAPARSRTAPGPGGPGATGAASGDGSPRTGANRRPRGNTG
mgnify:CR=1 FL=1